MDWSRHKRLNGLAEDDVTMEMLSDWLFMLAQDASEHNNFETPHSIIGKQVEDQRFVKKQKIC